MRVDGAVVVTVVALLPRGLLACSAGLLGGGEVEPGGRRDVEAAPGRGAGDRVVDRSLEAGLVDDDVGVVHRAELAGRELGVVRLGAGLGQAHDLDAVPADPRREVLERIEGRGDPESPAGAAGIREGAPAAGARPEQDREESGEEGALHDNHSQLS